MIGVRVGCVGMAVFVRMGVIMAMAVVMIMAVVMVGGLPGKDLCWIDDQGRLAWLGLAHLVADTVAVFTVFSCPDPLDVVVMTFLNGADFSLKAEYLCPVFAHLAVHSDVARQYLAYAFLESGDDQRMIVEVGGLDELDVGVARSDRIGRCVNTVNQNSGKQEVGEYDYATKTQPRRVFEGWLNQRECNTRICRLRPSETETLPEQSRYLGDVGIGVWIRGPSSYDKEQRFMGGNG